MKTTEFIMLTIKTLIITFVVLVMCGCVANKGKTSSTADWQEKEHFESPSKGLSDMIFIWE